MDFRETTLDGVLLIEPKVHRDDRGYFLETYREDTYAPLGIPFVQDNLSNSKHGTLRGLHAQVRKPQGKLVRATRGQIFDVAVDIRRGSPTFGHWFGQILSEENFLQLYVPPDFAHGFYVLSEWAVVEYKCTDFYDPAPGGELSVLWNDPGIGIDWPLDGEPLLSAKDAKAQPLADIADLPSFEP